MLLLCEKMSSLECCLLAVILKAIHMQVSKNVHFSENYVKQMGGFAHTITDKILDYFIYFFIYLFIYSTSCQRVLLVRKLLTTHIYIDLGKVVFWQIIY